MWYACNWLGFEGGAFFSTLSCFLGKPPRGGKRQRSSLSAIINKRIRDGVIAKRPKRDRKRQQKSLMEDFVLSLFPITSSGFTQNEPDTISSNHVRQDTEVDK